MLQTVTSLINTECHSGGEWLQSVDMQRGFNTNIITVILMGYGDHSEIVDKIRLSGLRTS